MSILASAAGRIFVNNIRGNLIICLLHCFNFERFFFPNPRSVADTPTRSVQFNVFTRGEVRLVGGRFPSGVGNERLATLRRIREIVRVTHVVEAGTCAGPRARDREQRKGGERGEGERSLEGEAHEGTIRANECLLVKQTRFSTLSLLWYARVPFESSSAIFPVARVQFSGSGDFPRTKKGCLVLTERD